MPQRDTAGLALVCESCGNNQIVDPNNRDECVCSAGTYDAAHGFVFCWPEAGKQYSVGTARTRKQDTLDGLRQQERAQLSQRNGKAKVCMPCPSACTDCGQLGAGYVKAGWGFGRTGASLFHGIAVGTNSSDKAVFKCGSNKTGCDKTHVQNASCPTGYGNPMCAVCLPGYGGGTRRPCRKCKQTRGPGWVVAEILAMAFGLWGIFVLWTFTQDVSDPSWRMLHLCGSWMQCTGGRS